MYSSDKPVERKEGEGSFANMPKDVKMKEYPKPGYSGDRHLDDTITRLDSDTSDAMTKQRKSKPGSMY